MKNTFLLAILLVIAGRVFAQTSCQYNVWPPYGGWACVQAATVSGWNGCTGTLNVEISPAPNYTGTYPVELEDNIGKTCPYGPDPYGYGCYTAPGATSISIGISVTPVSQPTLIPFWVAVAYDDNGQNVSVLAMPNCQKRKCPGTGKCPCNSDGANGPDGNTTCGKPINLATGNTYITEVDVKRLPGTGSGLTLERTWNSLWPRDEMNSATGLFGPHWKSTYEERVYLASDGMMEYSAGDGSFTYFALNGGVWTAAVPVSPATVLSTGSSYWTLTFPSGETRLFSNTSGSLTLIKDRNGNTTQIAYDSLGRISTVTDAASRHLYFAYPSNTSWLVSAVTSDVGIALSYFYDSHGRLASVVNPDMSTESFQYSDLVNSYLITTVQDSQGKILESHTYDSTGRGLTSSRANGVESLSISYSN